jgi:hypothetical protein
MSAGRKNTITKKDWNTPPKYITPITNFFGKIELDPCSNNYSLVNAATSFIFPSVDGLKEEWNHKTVFVNPPYGRNGETSLYDWLKKSVLSFEKYKSEIILLIPVATNTKHFKELVFKKCHAICFLEDTRLKFYNNGIEDKKGAPMACCLIYIGNRKDKFKKDFEIYGKTFLI